MKSFYLISLSVLVTCWVCACSTTNWEDMPSDPLMRTDMVVDTGVPMYQQADEIVTESTPFVLPIE